MNEYMTDDELSKLIADVEEHEIVKAPPGMFDAVLDKVAKRSKVTMYKRFRNRVIASVAAALVITATVPGWMKLIPETVFTKLGAIYNYENYESEAYIGKNETYLISNLGNNYYISNYLNGSEE